MSSYNFIAKWAKEAKQLLRQKNLAGVKTNLSMIFAQANEEIKREKKMKTQ